MFSLRHWIWPKWNGLYHYISSISYRIGALFLTIYRGERPLKDDVECPGNIPDQDSQIIVTKSPAVTIEPDNAVQQSYTKHITYIPVPGSWERRPRPNLPPERFIVPEARPGQIIYITKGKNLGCGGTARLERLPSGTSGDVIKTPLPDLDPRCHEDHCRSMRLEARIYETIGLHPRIPKIVSWDPETCCITMEYLENGSLREYFERNPSSVTPRLRRRWAQQAAEGLHVLHSAGVIHGDISPRNFLLDHDLHLKIADFGGSSLNGSPPSSVAGTRFRYPVSDWDAPATFEEDIFGLGSLIYFIMTGVFPYADIPSDKVEKLYECRTFPDVTQLSCGDIIKSCWSQQVSIAELLPHIEALDEP